jgi:drug/metabolite transporter (DMT)-like permease
MRSFRVRTHVNGYTLAIIAVFLFSTSPALTRFATGIGPIEIAFWRLSAGAVAVAFFAAVTHHRNAWRRLATREFAGYGALVALHFGSFVASLVFTSTAHSLAITYTAPVFVAVTSWALLSEPISRRGMVGIVIAIAGATYLTGFEPVITARGLLGDGFALVTAITFGFYSIAGRRARDEYPLFDYAFGAYAWGAAWLLPFVLWEAPGATRGLVPMLAVAGAGFLPLGTGHTLYNAALRRIPATAANVIAVFEVVGGTILTALIFGEIPSATSVIGAGILLVGILVVVLDPAPHRAAIDPITPGPLAPTP